MNLARSYFSRLPVFALGLLISLAGGQANAGSADSENGATLSYNRDVRPILAEACFSCHGPDSAAREADLRLDQQDAAVDYGAIVPGDPSESGIILRITAEDEAERMPPPETGKSLTREEQELLQEWIRQGAVYEPHWSLIPPERPAVPEVANQWWVRNPIDNFVAAKLESEGLQPAPEAQRRTLVRRLSLDLTGLPPEPDFVEDFVNDPAPDAYERLVDKLLASPSWGEHRGRYWLDAARYADTHGIHFDNYREMWSYRDWVIETFNRNMPFDTFTIENLAGDLLPEATLDQQIASGFNRCNITTNEGGAIDEEYLVLYARDRVETTCQVWMGLTAGCAVCHDHKFDPLSQREFYELAAFFNNTTQKAMDGNIKDTPPVVVVPLRKDRQRWDELADEIPRVRAELDQRRQEAKPAFDAWLTTADPEKLRAESRITGLELEVPLDEGGDSISYRLRGELASAPRPANVEWRSGRLGTQAAFLNQGEILVLPEAGDFDSGQPFSYAAWVNLPANDVSAAVLGRMDKEEKGYRGWDLWVEGRRIGAHFINKWSENAIKVVSRDQLPANEWVHVTVVYDGSSKAAGVRLYVNGVSQPTNVTADSLSGSIRTEVPLVIGRRFEATPLSGATIQDVRIYSKALADGEVKSLGDAALFQVVATPAEQRDPADVAALFEWWLTSNDDQFHQITESVDQLVREQDEIKARGTVAHVMHEADGPPAAHVLNRGEYDQPLEQVTPATPAMLPPLPEDLPRDRLGFAKWLLLPEHPLTARVTVNRFWSEVFGTGLVKTAGDFGITGTLPSHPELLDWLAVEFRDSGWDVKQLFRLIVTSAAYRQSAAVTPEKLSCDPENRLLSRGPRFRMDAEMVRDYALATSGLLNEKIGGPSVKPYQPPGVWEAVAMIGSNTRDYVQDSGDALYRRSIYTFWKRAAPPASMDVFNAPARETCTMVRERTNTPLQALVTLNDPQFVEAARHLAETAIEECPEKSERITFIANRLLARRLRAEEQEIVRSSLYELEQYYDGHPEDAKKLIQVGDSVPAESIAPAQLAAWTMLANQLMNLDEVLNK